MFSPEHRVVVLIITYQERLSKYENISLQQCLKVLKNYPIRIVKPASADLSSWNVSDPDIKTEDFADHYFKDIGAYSRLLISTGFYKRFEEYEYLLIYQLDAFIFNDDLLSWCNKGFDYIGAPWFEKFSSTNSNAPFVGGGNGGFSLRKIESHLRVLNSFSYINPPAENWRQRMQQQLSLPRFLHEACGFLLDLTVRNNTFWMLNSFKGFEDQFWCLVAARNFSWFKIPDYKEAMNFAMEMQPRRVFDINDHRLPLGCHAWWKYDLDFWKPYISEYGYQL